MQINELAEQLAVSASTLRHWEKSLEAPVPRDALGQRTYPPEWVAYFSQVKALLDAGKKYAEIKLELQVPQPDLPDVSPDELTALKNAFNELETRQNESDKAFKTSQQALIKAEERLDAMREDLTHAVDDVVKFSRKLAQVEQKNEALEQANQALLTDFKDLKHQTQEQAQQAQQTQQKLKELEEKLKQVQDQPSQTDLSGLEQTVQTLEVNFKKVHQELKQSQTTVAELVDLQAGTGDELADLQKQIKALQQTPDLSGQELQALKLFKERFWWYMVAIVFFYMVLTISVIEGFR